MVGDLIGNCIENERTDMTSGDSQQNTIGGLLVWRKADGLVAFTNGDRTWIRGPDGAVYVRKNTERFLWETIVPGTARLAIATPSERYTERPTAINARIASFGNAPATPAPVAISTPSLPVPTPVSRQDAVPTPTTRAVSTAPPVSSTPTKASVLPSFPKTDSLVADITSQFFAGALRRSGLPVSAVEILTGDTDPAKLLGKAGQYQGKVVWRDQRAPNDEASIEFFPDDASLRARSNALGGETKPTLPMGALVIVNAANKSILRLPKGLNPQNVQGYQTWLQKMI